MTHIFAVLAIDILLIEANELEVRDDEILAMVENGHSCEVVWTKIETTT
jgi:hypothetical protein